MPSYRLKHSFTAGELSPLMHERVDFERYRNGCKVMHNFFCATQGPAVRRPGFKFVYDLTALGLDSANPEVRTIPFVFNEVQAYAMVFFRHVDGLPRVVFATTTEAGEDGLVEGSGVACPYAFDARADYTGPATYNFYFPQYLTYVDADAYHIAANGDRTDFTEVAGTPAANEFKVTYTAATGLAAMAVGTGSPATGGVLHATLNFTAVAISSDQVVSLTLPSGWDIENFDWAQSADEMYIAQDGFRPYVIKRHGHTCWSLHQIFFAGEPDDWSDAYGWPQRVTFHQQRLVFAANDLRRQTVWMSKAGDYLDFGVSSPLVDSDAVSFTLASGTQNRIQWLASSKSLHIGTMGNEWTVIGNDQSALTPSNILAQRQTNNGSETNKPLMVGLTTLFVERHGRAVNEFVYDYTYDSFKTSDMAILSPHLTEHYSIVDWTYQQTPDSIIWCVREDGMLLGITYQRDHKVVGWHRHTTQGFFRAITAIPGNTREDDVWVVVQRVLPSGTRYYLEKLADWFKSNEAKDGRFLDSYVEYDGLPIREVEGLDHLEGLVVEVLADGTVHPPLTVRDGGLVSLNGEYSVIAIGLGYESEIRPHLVDLESQEGTSRGRTQRITRVAINFYRTLGGYIGRHDQRDGDAEEELPFRVPGDLLGVQVPLYTGWFKYSIAEGFDQEPEYYIKQKQPLPMTVCGVNDEVEVHGI